MEHNKKISTVIVSFAMLVSVFLLSITSVFAWFDGQGYVGKTMSYSRSMHIGTTDSSITNYYGYTNASQDFVYAEIDPLLGFQQNNLVPGSFLHIRTDIENNSSADYMLINLYLQNIVYDSPLHNFLYFGTNDPTITRELYKNIAVYDDQTDQYTIRSIPLLTSCVVEASETISLYWYIYIDSDAGMEVANTNIDFGNVIVTYN